MRSTLTRYLKNLFSTPIAMLVVLSVEEDKLDKQISLDRFLASVEARSFRMAEMATRNRDDALDIVQEAMIKLVRKYADKPESEWPALFRRILQNGIVDWHRKRAVKNRVMSWLGMGKEDSADESYEDPIQTAKDINAKEPLRELVKGIATERMIEAVTELPLRQQQAFLLRSWEGLNVKETAVAMGCTDGSVKTHYSRAVVSLRAKLKAHWDVTT